MEVAPFSAPGKFWRGNLHTHSNRSDGALDPDEVARRYQLEGYDFLALTDHFVGLYDYPLTNIQSFENENFTTILVPSCILGGGLILPWLILPPLFRNSWIRDSSVVSFGTCFIMEFPSIVL